MNKPKRKTGRPTKLTRKVEERLLKAVSAGATFREACRAARIDFHAVINMRFASDDFHRRSARATLLGTEANLELAETRLKRSTNRRIAVDRELAHHYRWKASKLLSAYKDRVGVDLGIDGQSVLPASIQEARASGEFINFEFGRRLIFQLRLAEEDLERMDLPNLAKYLKAEKLLLGQRGQKALLPPAEVDITPKRGSERG